MSKPTPTPTVERSEVAQISKDDKAGFAAKAKASLDGISAVVPENVQCLAAVVIARDPSPEDPDRMTVTSTMLGSDEDIARMLSTLIQIARNGVVQAHTPTNPGNNTAH